MRELLCYSERGKEESFFPWKWERCLRPRWARGKDWAGPLPLAVTARSRSLPHPHSSCYCPPCPFLIWWLFQALSRGMSSWQGRGAEAGGCVCSGLSEWERQASHSALGLPESQGLSLSAPNLARPGPSPVQSLASAMPLSLSHSVGSQSQLVNQRLQRRPTQHFGKKPVRSTWGWGLIRIRGLGGLCTGLESSPSWSSQAGVIQHVFQQNHSYPQNHVSSPTCKTDKWADVLTGAQQGPGSLLTCWSPHELLKAPSGVLYCVEV